jgi:chlorobactene glucosyltransferase
MLLYQIIIAAILLVPLGVAVANWFAFAEIRRRDRPARTPRISLLVPARNEERSIEECVLSLLAQEYPEFEVIVLDDNSEDRTGEILARLEREDPRLRVVAGEPLPEGWAGKNWACHQLAARATGAWLLFTDADTRHTAQSASACMALAEREGLRFLSGVPLQRMEGFWEEAIIPMVHFLYFAYLPNRWITTRHDPRFSAANGQLILMERGAYDATGGHEAARGELVEDVWLGRAAKRAGVRSGLAIAREVVECRMYRSLGEIVAGFGKNLYPGLGYSPLALAIFVGSSLLLYVLPLGFVAAAILTGRLTPELFLLPLLQLLVAAAIRGMIAHRFGMRPRQIILHPLSALLAAIIAIHSMRLVLTGGPMWKGRRYS